MNEALRMTLSKLNPHAGHILVVGRGDSKVLVLGTANAGNRLSFISQASPLELDVTALETEHYREIERDLVARFSAYRDDGYGHWLQTEYNCVVAALNEYDLETGARIRSGDLKIGDRAFVPGIGKGEVTGFMTGLRPRAWACRQPSASRSSPRTRALS
jgi:hypothetical protein